MKRKINWMLMVVVFYFFNIFNPIYMFMDDDEGQIAYAQDGSEQKVWTMLDADLQGTGVSWKPAWTEQLQAAKAMMEANQFSCLEVSGVEDITGFNVGNTELRAAGGEDPLRAVRARARASFVMNKLMEVGVAGSKIREGTMTTRANEGQRGAVIRLIEDCIPKPPVQCWDSNENYKCDGDEDVNKDSECNVKDCQGNDGTAKVEIKYDLVGQYVKYLGSPERDPFTGILLRANFPISDKLTLGLAAEYGKANEIGAAGFELDAEWDWFRWIKPRISLIGRAYNLTTHLYFKRGEVGGGVGFSGELVENESWSIIYQVVGEWKYDIEYTRWEWEAVKSATGAIGVRF
ncbi:MAG: hypothetical protein PHN19_00620 [Patescibacteria group bacterium]|nr:hypothetical protein [Patescibacteria group bacterium]